MKRHVAVVVALVTTLAVIDSHVDWARLDGRPILEINGQRFDLAGWASEHVRQLRRSCSPSPTQPLDSPTALAVLAAIQQHSLPDSRSARLQQILQMGEWSLAETVFEGLNPSLVVLRLQDGLWQVQDRAIWSGSTSPWNSADFVRRYLRRQAPDLPERLLNCLHVDPVRFGMGPGGLGPVTTPVDSRP